MPKFSVIIPTYNRGYILWRTLLSIQSQQFNNFECFIIDDGSTDDTEKVVQFFLEDSRFFYHKQTNGGASNARQSGLQLSNGDIITYVDSDDPVNDNYLKIANEVFTGNSQINYCLSNCNFYVDLLDRSNKTLSSKHLITHQSPVTLIDIYHWSKRVALGTGIFFKKSRFINQVKWNEDLPCFEDLDFIMQLACLDPGGFYFIMEVLFDYHQRYGLDGACSSISYQQWADAFAQLLELHHNDPLLTNKAAYLDRIDKYKQKHKLHKKGDYPAPHLKYFPEFSEKIDALQNSSLEN